MSFEAGWYILWFLSIWGYSCTWIKVLDKERLGYSPRFHRYKNVICRNRKSAVIKIFTKSAVIRIIAMDILNYFSFTQRLFDYDIFLKVFTINYIQECTMLASRDQVSRWSKILQNKWISWWINSWSKIWQNKK